MLTLLKLKPDIISVGETWIGHNKTLISSLDGYKFINKPCNGTAGGTGFFIKSNIEYNIIDNLELKLIDVDDMWIELNLANNKKLTIGSIYRHPSYSFNEFQTKLTYNIDKLNNLNKSFIIAGDININLLQETNNILNFKNELLSQGCIQTVTNPTRISQKNKDSLIDHVYTNFDDSNIITKTLSYEMSDHLPNITLINSCRIQSNSKNNQFLIRDMKKFSSDNFLSQLQVELGNISDEGLSVDDYWDIFEKTFNCILDFHAPLRSRTRKETKLSNKPWITKGIRKSIKTKQKLFKNILKNKSDTKWNFYKIYRNKLCHIIEASKRNHFNSEINHFQHNPKKIWKTINNIISLKRNKSNILIKQLNDDNKIIENPVDISNTFNNFFTNIGTNLSDKISPPQNSCKISPISHIKTCKNTFFLQPITSSEIIDIIHNLNHKKSTKSDCPSIKFLKLSSTVIAPTLSNIFNRCITEGVFPKSLKIAEIIPIYKSGDRSLAGNYRPISLLSAFSKIIERHIHNQLTKFIDKNQILHQFQYGFRSNSSTEMALSQLSEYLSSKLENKLFTCSIFIDLKKAFDTVNHTNLLSKLYFYGIRGLPAKLLHSYLSNRSQATLVNGYKSLPSEVKCGVPQGSILGPLLFLIYINDLARVSSFDVRLFADDACLILDDKNPKRLQNNINHELIKINNWMTY